MKTQIPIIIKKLNIRSDDCLYQHRTAKQRTHAERMTNQVYSVWNQTVLQRWWWSRTQTSRSPPSSQNLRLQRQSSREERTTWHWKHHLLHSPGLKTWKTEPPSQQNPLVLEPNNRKSQKNKFTSVRNLIKWHVLLPHCLYWLKYELNCCVMTGSFLCVDVIGCGASVWIIIYSKLRWDVAVYGRLTTQKFPGGKLDLQVIQ